MRSPHLYTKVASTARRILDHQCKKTFATISANCRLTHRSKSQSLDHLVGGRKERRRNTKAEPLGGLEIEREFELGWRLHRKVSGLLAPEDAIDIARRASVLVGEIRAIGNQPTGADEQVFVVDRREFIPRRKIN